MLKISWYSRKTLNFQTKNQTFKSSCYTNITQQQFEPTKQTLSRNSLLKAHKKPSKTLFQHN